MLFQQITKGLIEKIIKTGATVARKIIQSLQDAGVNRNKFSLPYCCRCHLASRAFLGTSDGLTFRLVGTHALPQRVHQVDLILTSRGSSGVAMILRPLDLACTSFFNAF